MRIKIHFLFFVFFFTFFGFTQKLSSTQQQTIHDTLETHFGKPIADNFIYNQGVNQLVYVGKDTFYVPNGYFYVFQLKNNKALRKEGCRYHGSNFRRFLFSHNQKIYALGGYGLFSSTNHLLYFNKILKGWSYVATKGDKPKSVMGNCIKKGDKIYTFGNCISGNATDKDVFDPYLYMLDLKTKIWYKYAFKETIFNQPSTPYQLKDYLVVVCHDQTIIVSHEKMKYLVVNNEDFGYTYNRKISQVDKNSLFIQHMDSTSLSSMKSVSMDYLWKIHTYHQLLEYTPISKPFLSGTSWVIILLIGFICFMFFRIYRIKQNSINLVAYSPLHLKFVNHPSKLFTQEEFDELLEIDTMEADSKKLKRHRIISELNNNHPNFIERIKDENDKRRNLYKINDRI
jgi:hypothetical protein